MCVFLVARLLDSVYLASFESDYQGTYNSDQCIGYKMGTSRHEAHVMIMIGSFTGPVSAYLHIKILPIGAYLNPSPSGVLYTRGYLMM